MSSETPDGKVTDYFWKRNTVRIEVLDDEIQEGDTLHITGEYTDVTVDAEEMEVEDEAVDTAEEGEIFAMPVEPQDRVVLGDEVFVKSE